MDELVKLFQSPVPLTAIIGGLIVLGIIIANNAPKTVEQFRLLRQEDAQEKARQATEHTKDRLALMQAAANLEVFTKESLELLKNTVSEFASLATQKNALDMDYRRVVSQLEGMKTEIARRDARIEELEGEVGKLKAKIAALETPKKAADKPRQKRKTNDKKAA